MDTFFLANGGWGGILSAPTSSVKNSTSWVLLVGAAVALLLLSTVYSSTRGKYSNLPPGPRNWPLIGAILEMEPQIHLALAKLTKKYGDILYFRLGVQSIVLVSSAKVAEELLKHKDGQFANRFAPMTRNATKYCGFNGGGFLWSDYDAEHILTRKIMITELFTVAKLKKYEELRRQEIAVMVEKILKTIESRNKLDGLQNGERGVTIGIKDTFTATSFNIIFALVTGERFDRLSPTNHLREFPRILREFERLGSAFNVVDILPFLAWFDPQGLLKEFKAFGQEQTEFYEKIISNRRRLREAQRGGNVDAHGEVSEINLVDVLLNFQEKCQLGDNYILGALQAILVAGVDTTAPQLEWIMLELARHPEMLQRLQAEVDGVVGMARPVDETDIQVQNMPFLNAVVMEAVRLHPVVAYSFPHTNKETATLSGYTIPPNTAVSLNFPLINRDSKIWKDPLRFNPERFMGVEGEKIKANGTNYGLLTFSGGRRGCAGYSLAWVLLLRTTATLVHAFDWSPPPGLSPKDLRTEELRGQVFVNPIVKLSLTPTPRMSSHLYKSKDLS